MNFRFFYAQLLHSEIDNIIKYLVRYMDEGAKYIIGMEISPNTHKETKGQHMHFACQMDDKQYDAFRHTVFTNTYKLRGRASKDLPRQFGQIKQVRDETKFLAYTVKDKNIRTNIIDEDEIRQYIEASYPKVEKKSKEEEIMEHLLTHKPELKLEPYDPYNIDFEGIEKCILRYYMSNGQRLCKSQLKNLTLTYLQCHMKNRECPRQFDQIYCYLKNYN